MTISPALQATTSLLCVFGLSIAASAAPSAAASAGSLGVEPGSKLSFAECMEVVRAVRSTRPVEGSVNVVSESADRVVVELVGGKSARRITGSE